MQVGKAVTYRDEITTIFHNELGKSQFDFSVRRGLDCVQAFQIGAVVVWKVWRFNCTAFSRHVLAHPTII